MTTLRPFVASLAASIVLSAVAFLVVAGRADANPARLSQACHAFTGPAWRYSTGTAPTAPLYRGTRYEYAALRMSCARALPLVRKAIAKTWHGVGPATLRIVPHYACLGRVPNGKKVTAGYCLSNPAAGQPAGATSFSWSPQIHDPTSQRIR
jgi:hypothetical protein